MILTAAQLTALATDITNDATLNAIAKNADGFVAIAAAYSVLATPDFFVYRSAIPIDEINNGITWKTLTPSDAVPTDTQLNALIWQSRALMCQACQFNLQIVLQGRQTINAGKKNVRQGIRDALQAIPSGAAGVAQDAGWVNLRDTVLARKATRGEKLFADVTNGNGGTVANAAEAPDGSITAQNVQQALGL